ncbi:hypothetical protein ACROYT_G023578 [Oculina patagonica]
MGHMSSRKWELPGKSRSKVLIDVIRKHHQQSHLIDMLTEVTRQVVERGTTANDKMPNVQVPTCSHTLRARLFLSVHEYKVPPLQKLKGQFGVDKIPKNSEHRR